MAAFRVCQTSIAAWLLGVLIIAAQAQSSDLADLSSASIYRDLKARGLDPLDPSVLPELRQAYVIYDFEFGTGRNFAKAGDEVTVSKLNAALARTAVTSLVSVKTRVLGARVRYQLYADRESSAFPQLTNDAKLHLPIGIYTFWAERSGAQTSIPITLRIIEKEVPVDLEERT